MTKSRPHLLLVDDEASIRDPLGKYLERQGFRVSDASNASTARSMLLSYDIDLVLLDIWMPGMDGIQTLERVRNLFPDLTVVMMSGHGTIETAVKATRMGAFDFIEKPFSLDKVLITIANALNFKELRKENEALRQSVQKEHEMVGSSAGLELLRGQVQRIAPASTPVLIHGEEGVGKELVAQHIRARMAAQPGARHDLPMVAINCAAIHEGLLESELFGHEAGAFTGANKRHHGVFERANGGVLFLDEIGDMAMPVQAKLLRVLLDGQVCRLGSEKDLHVSVRLICATHKRLDKMAETGAFRRDLLFRISGVPMDLNLGVFMGRVVADNEVQLQVLQQLTIASCPVLW